mmetsp:Transcript_40743/g.95615  ORF Transcript_40743/g.95615 Transcript_40743/m.95615 type:complete len:81 (+) Transcript_40743:192-434(+)
MRGSCGDVVIAFFEGTIFSAHFPEDFVYSVWNFTTRGDAPFDVLDDRASCASKGRTAVPPWIRGYGADAMKGCQMQRHQN